MRPDPAASPFTPRMALAIRRAVDWHRHHSRKASGLPYAEHLFGVALILQGAGFDEDVVIAGLLHDAVEDLDHVSLDDIRDEFGPRVARLVEDCTEVKRDPAGEERPWLDRKRDHIAHLDDAPVESRAVALADKLHNQTSILLDLETLGPAVWERFTTRDMAPVLWYHETMVETLGRGDERLERLADQCRALLARIRDRAGRAENSTQNPAGR